MGSWLSKTTLNSCCPQTQSAWCSAFLVILPWEGCLSASSGKGSTTGKNPLHLEQNCDPQHIWVSEGGGGPTWPLLLRLCKFYLSPQCLFLKPHWGTLWNSSWSTMQEKRQLTRALTAITMSHELVSLYTHQIDGLRGGYAGVGFKGWIGVGIEWIWGVDLRIGRVSHSVENFIWRPKERNSSLSTWTYRQLSIDELWSMRKQKGMKRGEVGGDLAWRALNISTGIRLHPRGQCSSSWGLLTTWKPRVPMELGTNVFLLSVLVASYTI